jgi:adenylate cyclase
MALTPSFESVRRPISLKIFGIAIALLVLMIVVTLFSSMNLRRVEQQLTLLADSYIRLDQVMGALRAQGLREQIQIERVIRHKVKSDAAIGNARAQDLFKEAGDCEDASLGPVRRKIRDAYADRGEQQLMLYRVTRLCTNVRLARANELVGAALASPTVRADPDQVERFTRIKTELGTVAGAREKYYASFEKYLRRLTAADETAIVALQEELDDRRRDVLRPINSVSRLLAAGTREAAERTQSLETRTQWLGWSITVVACALGLLFAAVITRSLVRPVRELLALTRTIRTGNLDVNIQVKTADEIGQLADSFNHMVGELKQKESIKRIFGKFVDPRIVQNLLLGTPQLAGERQVMSVFFSDIEGFTAICEDLTPTAAVRLLNEYFTLMSESIHAEQGIIDKYIGDSVMAFWGPPFVTRGDFAALACHAALAQQACVPRLQNALPEILGRRRNLPVIRARMGIATGDVTVGSIGSEESRTYTVIGDTVNLASRLEGANKLYHTQILICEDTWRLAGAAIEAREVDTIRVVGKSDAVRVYELLARTGELTPAVADLRTRYDTALHFYRAHKLDDALRALEECLTINPADGPSLVWRDRIRGLIAGTLTEPRDGVWSLTQK